MIRQHGLVLRPCPPFGYLHLTFQASNTACTLVEGTHPCCTAFYDIKGRLSIAACAGWGPDG